MHVFKRSVDQSQCALIRESTAGGRRASDQVGRQGIAQGAFLTWPPVESPMPPVALSRASRGDAGGLGDRLLSTQSTDEDGPSPGPRQPGTELTMVRTESPLRGGGGGGRGGGARIDFDAPIAVGFSTTGDEQEPDPVAQTVNLNCRLSVKIDSARLGVEEIASMDPRTFTLSGMGSAADVQEAVRDQVRARQPTRVY